MLHRHLNPVMFENEVLLQVMNVSPTPVKIYKDMKLKYNYTKLMIYQDTCSTVNVEIFMQYKFSPFSWTGFKHQVKFLTCCFQTPTNY